MSAIPPLSKWPADLRYEYEERAAIREYEGGAARIDAEQQAMAEVWQRHMKGTQEGLGF